MSRNEFVRLVLIWIVAGLAFAFWVDYVKPFLIVTSNRWHDDSRTIARLAMAVLLAMAFDARTRALRKRLSHAVVLFAWNLILYLAATVLFAVAVYPPLLNDGTFYLLAGFAAFWLAWLSWRRDQAKSDSQAKSASLESLTVWAPISVAWFAAPIYVFVDNQLYHLGNYRYAFLPLYVAIPLVILALIGPIWHYWQRDKTKSSNTNDTLPHRRLGLWHAPKTVFRWWRDANMMPGANGILLSIGIILARIALALGLTANLLILYYFGWEMYPFPYYVDRQMYPFFIRLLVGSSGGIWFALWVNLNRWQRSRQRREDEASETMSQTPAH